MSTFKIILWTIFLLLLTVFVWQNLSDGMTIKLFFWHFSLPTVVGIFLFMFIGSVIVLPLAIKSRIKKRRKAKEKEEAKQKKLEEKQSRKKGKEKTPEEEPSPQGKN